MNRNLSTVLVCLVLAGCGNENSDSKKSTVQKDTGNFSGTVADNQYKVDVKCSYFDEDYFQFLSDRTDVSDTNGDGIIISGMENNGKLVLTVVDNGKTFSTGNLANYKKGDAKAEGSGKLFEEGTSAAYEVQFVVTCG